MKRWIKNNYKILIILSSIFLFMYILNSMTPIMSDDFGYSFNLDHERLSGIKDIGNFQIAHYKWWGGRIVAHTLVQLFLLGSKSIFNIFNSLCFTLLIYLIYLISKKENKDNLLMLPIIFFLVYFLQPVFGQCCLWLTGACNYLWTTTIVLSLIYFYVRKKETKDSIIYTTFIFLLSIGAGWTNENTSVSLFIILLLLIFVQKKEQVKIKIWQILGLVGNIIGFLIMILAPGNYIREDGYIEETSFITKILNRFINCTKDIFRYEIVIIIIFILLMGFLIYKKKKINKNSIIFMIGSIMGVYPMIMSPTFPERSWFAVIIFGIISIIILANEINLIGKKEYTYLKLGIVLVLFTIFIPSYGKLILELNDLQLVWRERITYIKNNPNEDEYKFNVYSTTNRKNPMYDQIDLTENPKEWPNKDIANYYNIKNIGVKD